MTQLSVLNWKYKTGDMLECRETGHHTFICQFCSFCLFLRSTAPTLWWVNFERHAGIIKSSIWQLGSMNTNILKSQVHCQILQKWVHLYHDDNHKLITFFYRANWLIQYITYENKALSRRWYWGRAGIGTAHVLDRSWLVTHHHSAWCIFPLWPRYKEETSSSSLALPLKQGKHIYIWSKNKNRHIL